MAASIVKAKLEDDECSEYVRKKQNKSLLEKYDIPVSHLDYGYIADCGNVREMEKIVIILRSGQEGHYPDLLQKAEERLSVLKPTSKVLRVDTPIVVRGSLDPQSRDELLDDMTSWCGDMRDMETELKTSMASPAALKKARLGLPDVRNTVAFMTDSGERRGADNGKRIAACDYAAWDKYDPDTELLKMELEEEKNRLAAEERAKRDNSAGSKAGGVVVEQQQRAAIESLSDGERRLLADRQRLLGNESYRARDYRVARDHYARSVDICRTLAALNNLAAADLKLGRYEEASQECDGALSIEPDNVKALLRKAEALRGLADDGKALEYYEHVIKLDPNNTVAQKGAYECNRTLKLPPSKTVRLRIDDHQQNGGVELKPSPKIVELENSTDEKENQGSPVVVKKTSSGTMGSRIPLKTRGRTCLVPIPSTSNFVGPTVLEITIPEDMSMAKVDPSLVTTSSSSSKEKNEPKIIENHAEIQELAESPTAGKATSMFFEVYQDRVEVNDAQPTETIVDTSGDAIEPELIVVNEIAVQEARVENAPSAPVSRAGDRRPMREQDGTRAQRKKDKKRARRMSSGQQQQSPPQQQQHSPGNFPFQFRQPDMGSPGGDSGTIQVATKYRDATGTNAEFWPESKKSKNNGDHEKVRQRNENDVDDGVVVNDGNSSKVTSNGVSEKDKTEARESKQEHLTPFEFLKAWESIKRDDDFVLSARLLRQVDPNSLKTVIGNKLDATMLSRILECLRRHFTSARDDVTEYLARFLDSLTQLPRFAVIAMFLDSTDRDNLNEILRRIDRAGARMNNDMKKYLS